MIACGIEACRSARVGHDHTRGELRVGLEREPVLDGLSLFRRRGGAPDHKATVRRKVFEADAKLQDDLAKGV